MNGEWEVQRITSSIKVHIRDGYMMSTLVYRIQMERLRTFYTWNFLMPVGSLALAGLFTFYLPAKSQEKIALSLFVFLSIGVLTRLFLSCSSWLINHAIFPTFKVFAFKRLCDIRATFRDRFR
jgi:hypothetical protein